LYAVTLKVTNSNGCSDTSSREVHIPACITAGFDQNIQSACTNTEVSFFDQSLPVNLINQWYWNFGDGSDTLYTSFAGTIKHRYSNPGTYNVMLRILAGVNGQSYMDSIVRQVTIQPSPEVSFLALPACFNQINLFHDRSNSFGVDIISRIWNFGEPVSGINNTSSLTNPTHIYHSPGKYTVKLSLVNKTGCRDSLNKTVRVYGLPRAGFTNSIVCSANPVYFNDRSIIADTVFEAWKWNFGDPNTKKDTSGLSDPVYTYKEEGNYIVRLIVRDKNGCNDTTDSTITVYPSPVSAFILSENFRNMTGKIHLINKSEDADSYFWDFGNGITSTDENPVVTYSRDGNYTIMLASFNHFGCADTSYYDYELRFRGLFVPNAFVPESGLDGVNLFKPVGIGLKKYKVEVFDSWGHMLWESSSLDDQGRPTEGWNGRKSNGDLYQQGNYVWIISAVFTDGTTWEGSDIGKGEYSTMGTVVLIR
jgi:large repetitive protein